MSDGLERIDASMLFPPFLGLLRELLGRMRDRGEHFAVTADGGFRRMSEQQAMFMRGRLLPGKIVTNAEAGYSPHVYGLAADLARIEDGKYLEGGEFYANMGHEAETLGLIWGGRFIGLGDTDHIQWPGWVHKDEMEPLRSIYNARTTAKATDTGWLKDVWSFVLSNSPTMKYRTASPKEPP